MRNLFTVDKKDYKTDGTVFERPSVRGIVIKDGKILMIHSLKYDYYKLPGGGIEKGESYEEALIREVNEESGYIFALAIKNVPVDETITFEVTTYYTTEAGTFEDATEVFTVTYSATPDNGLPNV